MAQRPRMLHTDDHAMLRDAFRRLMERRCQVVCSVGDGRSLPDRVVKSRIATDLLPTVQAGRKFLSQMIRLEASS